MLNPALRDPNGFTPYSAVIHGRDGNFYGTTSNGGGPETGGTIFKITPDGVLTTLPRFSVSQNVNAFPIGKLVQGSDGNFYGMNTRKWTRWQHGICA